MTSARLARSSLYMANITLLFMMTMLLLNTAFWFYPNLHLKDGGYGLGFALSDRVLSRSGLDITTFTVWQKFGGIMLSGIPIIVLTLGLNYLRGLFQLYGRGDYFSSQTAFLLDRVGRAVALWVVLDLICEPLLSIWLTLRAPSGQHLITVSITPSSFVALFLAACIVLISRILQQASVVDAENKTFV